MFCPCILFKHFHIFQTSIIIYLLVLKVQTFTVLCIQNNIHCFMYTKYQFIHYDRGCSTIRPNTFRPITFRPMSFCPKTNCPTIFSPHDFCPYTILSCMIYVQKYFVHNVLGHKYLVQNRFSPKAFCLNILSPCPLLSTQF